MLCTQAEGTPMTVVDEKLKKLNECAEKMEIKEGSLPAYLRALFEAIESGAIREMSLPGAKYELYAEILETSE